MGPKRRKRTFRAATEGEVEAPAGNSPLRSARDKFRAHIGEHGQNFDVQKCIAPFVENGSLEKDALAKAVASMGIELNEEEVWHV